MPTALTYRCHRRTKRKLQSLSPADLPELLSQATQGEPRCPRVLLAGRLTAMASPGGGETQLHALVRALPHLGVGARLWRPWEDSFAHIDCLHLLGSAPEHLDTIAAAKRQGVPVVLSTIAWFDIGTPWREALPLWRQLAATGRFLARACVPGLPSWRRRLYHAADLLLPNSQAEAEQLIRYFQVPPHRIHVAPNGADERFAVARPQAFIRQVGSRRFVLYAGRIEPRKNQLGFLKAMQGTDVPIVVLGSVVPGQEAYLQACRQVAGQNVKFVEGIGYDDPRLASAYAACGCLVLASYFETPGLVALEAAMSGVPLVLTTRGCTHEYFGGFADYVDPDDLPAIRRKTLAALGQSRSSALARYVQRSFTWQAAAAATKAGYEKVLGQRKRSRPPGDDQRIISTKAAPPLEIGSAA